VTKLVVRLVRLGALSASAALGCSRLDGSGAAPTGSAAEAGAAHLASTLGGRVWTADFEMTARTIKDCKVDPSTLTRPGTARLGVEVWIRATGTREVPANPFYSRLVDGSGTEYSAVFGGCTPELMASVLRSGDQVEGFVTFEVPPAAQGLRLEYSPVVVGTERETIRIDLGR
jgi:hypothetical protein